MSVARLEVPFCWPAGIPLFELKIPSGAASWAKITLPRSIYPTHAALAAAIGTAVQDRYGIGSTDWYVDQDLENDTFSFISDTYSWNIQWTVLSGEGLTGLAAYMGFSEVDTTRASGVPLVSARAPSSFRPGMPISKPEWTIELNRVSNFTDAGRCVSKLMGAYMRHAFVLAWMHSQHDQWIAFLPWMIRAQKVAVWDQWDDASGDNYDYRALPADHGYRILMMDRADVQAIDAPAQAPGYVSHALRIGGRVYGL